MVYEKYTRKNGRTYGPYLYHNKRVDGRVVTSYHGKHEDKKGKLVIGLVGVTLVALVGIFYYMFFYFSNKFKLVR